MHDNVVSCSLHEFYWTFRDHELTNLGLYIQIFNNAIVDLLLGGALLKTSAKNMNKISMKRKNMKKKQARIMCNSLQWTCE